LKVLIVHDYCSLDGGAEQGADRLRKGLRERGIEVRVFAARTGHNEIADYLCQGTKGRFRTVLQTANVSAFLELRRVLREWRPDVIHLRIFLTQISPLILPLLRDIPTIYHAVWYRAICPVGTKLLPDLTPCAHNYGRACLSEGCLSVVDWPPLMLQMRMFSAWRGVFRAIVANSHALKKSLEESGIGPVRVIWNGVAAKEQSGSLLDEPTAAFSGRLVPAKGAAVLLRAFAGIPQGRLLIAGDGPERAPLETLSERLGLEKRVQFLGWLEQPDLDRKLRGSWVQVVPSLWAEPFGFVAPEAMMRGLAVVASNTGGLAEIVQDGKTGFLVRPGDTEALRDKISVILADKQLAIRMGHAGRESAMQSFEEGRWIESFIQLYRTVTGAGVSSA
jgi:glycosyltransferase involved in cell wall biosynthesis